VTSLGPNRTTTDEVVDPDEGKSGRERSASGQGERDSSVPGHHAPARLFGRARVLVLTTLVLVFLLAALSGRVIAPALLGWRAGIEPWIERAELTAAVLGQLAVVAGALMAIQLLIATLVESDLSVAYRLIAAPVTAGIVTLVMASSTRELPMLLTLALAVLSGVLATIASVPTVLRSHTRAAGMLLGIGGLTALLQVTSRTLALWASQEALASVFRVAQWLSTFVFVLDVLALVAAGVWLAARRWTASAVVASAALFGSGFVAWAALRGTGSPGGWFVLASQSLHSLARYPWPMLPPFAHFTVQLLLLVGAAIAVTTRSAQPVARTAIALALLARAGTDIPVLALALLLASLLGPLAAAREPASAPEREADERDGETHGSEQDPSPPADPNEA